MNVAHYNKDPKVNPIMFDNQVSVVSAMFSKYDIRHRRRPAEAGQIHGEA